MAEKGRVTIISSLLNFAPTHALGWRAQKINDKLQDAKYDGLAYVPMRSVLRRQINAGYAMRGLIAATHQSFREEEGWAIVGKSLRRLPNPVAVLVELGINATLFSTRSSDAEAARAQSTLSHKVPHVVHPYGQLIGDRVYKESLNGPHPRRDYHGLAESRHVGELQWQPTAEWAAFAGIDLAAPAAKVADAMVNRARRMGLGRAAVDLVHIQAVREGRFFGEGSSEHRIDYTAQLVGRLAATGNVGCIEFGVQSHMGSPHGTLNDIMDGNLAQTTTGTLFAATLRNMPPGEDVVLKTEIPEREFNAVGLDYQYGHEQLAPYLVQTAVNYLPAAA